MRMVIHVATCARSDRINRYFNGKCCDDEILFRAEISRKQLREVLHHYDEYVSFDAMIDSVRSSLDGHQLQIFLHPS